MRFVSLHSHSTFSYMDGYATPAQHVEAVGELGMSALALTEHGNVSSHVGLEKAANKAGIKPIFGLEAYTQTDMESQRKFHLTLLAMNQEGYRNLMRIVTRSWAEGFKRWPTVSGRMLRDHHEGIIVLSGCSDSLLACSLLGGKTIPPEEASAERAEKVARSFKRLLGDRFYLEVQMFPELPRGHQINTFYESLSQRLKIPLVATADVHYPRETDTKIRVLLHAAGRGNNTAAKQEESWDYDIPASYPTSDKMVMKRLLGTELTKRGASMALASTEEIAQRCDVTLPKADRLRFPGTRADLIWATPGSRSIPTS